MLRTAVFTILVSTASFAVANSEFDAEINALCEKTKSCAIAEMKKSLPPEMQEMALGMVSQACAGIQQSYSYLAGSEYAGLIDSATACMKSMRVKSCSDLMSGPETPECEAYEKEAEKYNN